MKHILNKYLRKLGAEVHGTGYIQKLKNADSNKSEWNNQKELLKNRADIIFDVGANRGETSLKYSDMFPQSEIHAFEPFPDSYAIFTDRLKHKKNIKLNTCALSNKTGTAILNVNKSIDTNSLLESKKIGASSDNSCVTVRQLEVDISTIDSYSEQNGISEIDILKIDVQGAELDVLNGAAGLLKKGNIKLIFIETFFVQQYVDQPLFHDISKFLYDYNFVLQDMYDPYYSNNKIIWCDSIFVNQKYFK